MTEIIIRSIVMLCTSFPNQAQCVSEVSACYVRDIIADVKPAGYNETTAILHCVPEAKKEKIYLKPRTK